MPDIAAISTVLSSVKTAVDIAKILKDADANFEKAELKLQLAELLGALADVKIELTEVQELIMIKDARIEELELAFDLQGEMVRVYDAYYSTDEQGNAVGEPYCLNCWQLQHKAYQLHHEAGSSQAKVCSVCKTKYSGRMTRKIPLLVVK